MPTLPPHSRRGSWTTYAFITLLVAIATVAVFMLLANIARRKAEGTQVYFPLVQLDETSIDPETWGKNFPRQYDAYKRTADNPRARFGGSEAIPEQKLDADPRLRTIFAGYAFSLDYRERRGHAFMLADQRDTERVKQRPQPGSCLQCHASNIVAYRKIGIDNGAPGTISEAFLSEDGQAQLFKGFEAVCAMKYNDATKLVDHPVGCIDCHQPENMQLRVTRPAFITGIRALATSADPVPHLPSIEHWRNTTRQREYDPNVDATRQEMRSLVCAQCHVEYYFKGDQKIVTYPWTDGLKVEQIEKYYDDTGFKDWTHAISGAPILKAQHPEFETWSQGVHARSGVACADCHMPYTREGAIKISDHQVRTPLSNIARACQTCHHYPEEEILARVTTIQNRTEKLLGRAEDATVDLINAIKAAKDAGATDDQLKVPRDLHRKAQWREDFVNAENSMGFHAPQETARILGEAIDYARQGQVEVAKLKPAPPSKAP